MFKKHSEVIYIMLEFVNVITNNTSSSIYNSKYIVGVNILKELDKTLD